MCQENPLSPFDAQHLPPPNLARMELLPLGASVTVGFISGVTLAFLFNNNASWVWTFFQPTYPRSCEQHKQHKLLKLSM
jgi:hypothetical protein